MLQITREKGTYSKKNILHRIADIPGGVTIKTEGLKGTLLEGTPIAPLNDDSGLWGVVKVATISEKAGANTLNYKVTKGTPFSVGDEIAKDDTTNVSITGVDDSKANYDIITVSETLGAKSVNDDLVEAGGSTPLAVTGTEKKVSGGKNLFMDAWVHAVVRGNAPAYVKDSLKNITYLDY